MQGSGQLYPILVRRGPGGPRLHVPESHPLQLNRSHVLLQVGKKRLSARVIPAPDVPGVLQLDVGRVSWWPRRLECRLWVRQDAHGVLRVGPIVGIMSAVYRKVRYGPQDGLFRRMLEEAESLGILAYVLSPGALRANGAVLGYRHDGKRWRAAYFPPPHVLYNRTQATPGTVAIERSLRRRYGVRIFNRRIGSKWRQYRILRTDPQMRSHLPVTRPLRSAADLQYIVRRFGGAYVKPSRGGFGRGVWRIERLRRGYDVRRTDGAGRSHRLGTLSLTGAFLAIRRRRRAYIVQQRLHLIRWRGSVSDVRVLMQKDGKGVWRLTGAGVRAGRGMTIVSNLSGGGQAVSLSEVLQVAFADQPEKAAELQQLVPEIARRVATRLERRVRPLGELGIDLGIDRNGRIWFLEANSRTGRSLFHQLDPDNTGRLADRRPMEYAAYLSGFSLEQPNATPHTI